MCQNDLECKIKECTLNLTSRKISQIPEYSRIFKKGGEIQKMKIRKSN